MIHFENYIIFKNSGNLVMTILHKLHKYSQLINKLKVQCLNYFVIKAESERRGGVLPCPKYLSADKTR